MSSGAWSRPVCPGFRRKMNTRDRSKNKNEHTPPWPSEFFVLSVFVLHLASFGFFHFLRILLQ